MNNSGLMILVISRIKTRCNRHLGASSTSLCCENAVSDLKTKPPTSDLYEIDFYVWTQEQARLLAARETGIAFGLVPEECPFTPDQIVDLDFCPEDRSIE
jgi:hypothetical protein